MTVGADPSPATDACDEDDALADSSGVWCEWGSARAVIAAAILDGVVQLERELPRARVGEDPEGVHQARVATRRLRSDLRTFGPLLDATWRSETGTRLKRLTDALGAVRDTDVMAMRLQTAIDDTGVDAEAASSVLTVLDTQGCSARRSLIREIDDDRTAELMARLRAAASDTPTTASALGRAELRLRPLVARPWQKLARRVDELDDEPTIAQLHRIRLLAKRTRYAAEAVTGVYGRDARRFARAVSGIQDVLGDMNDAEVAMAWLRRTADELDPSSAFVAGELTHHFGIVADAHHHGWERSFERARKRSAWLG